MKHHTRVEWADFVRGIASEETARKLSEHLATGCKQCHRTTAVLRRMLDLASTDARETPPQVAKRSVKALFALHQPDRRSRFSRPGLQLAATSGLVSQGVRTAASSGQPAHYESSDYSLDLRLDDATGGSEAVLSGQLLRQDGEPVPETAAFLLSGGRVAASCFTGDLGDFQMQLGRREAAELWLLVGEGEAINVALDAASASSC